MTFLKNSRNYMLFMLTALCSQVFGHTYLSAVFLNNQLLNQGDCVRPHPSTAFDSPIPLVTSADMTCGWLPSANNAANKKCPIAAGSSIGLQWHHNSNSASDDIIEATHKGPVIVYLAKSDSGAGNVWFKIYEDGLSNGQWGVDRLIANKGRVDVTIPSDIAPGNYLMRGEVIALHSAYDPNGVQPYVGCVELTISGTGSATPTGVSFPGYYKNTDPGMLINIYNTVTSYIIPGPAVYKSGSGSSSGSSSSGSSSSSSGSVTQAPTVAPTSRPPTGATSRPTSSPVSNGESLKFTVNGGTNVWWFAIALSGANEETVKIELKDSGAISNYYIMSTAAYGWYFSQSIQLTLPISLRFTSASGQQIILENYITSFSDFSLKDTQRSYSSPSTSAPTTKPTSAPVTQKPTSVPVSTTKPTSAPVTQKPTSVPVSTPKPTNPPSSGNTRITVKQHSGASAWWFAVAVNGIDSGDISNVEIKDSNEISSFSRLESTSWGYYTFTTPGFPLVAPFSVRVTSTSGKQAIATFSSFSGNAEVQTTI